MTIKIGRFTLYNYSLVQYTFFKKKKKRIKLKNIIPMMKKIEVNPNTHPVGQRDEKV